MRPGLLAAVTAVTAATAVLTACAGSSELEQCVQHSVEEGVDEVRAQQACEDALGQE